ncbi:MAG: hypothetical protein HOH33_07760 [Verrucomicrobia bacterium]|nr:hypothetical protein [Verrucomicrobiota bacterium]
MPWNQHNHTLQSWVHQELLALVEGVEDKSFAGRRLNAASFIHQLFLSTVVKYPELWSLRRSYYASASSAIIQIWRAAPSQDSSFALSFACLPEETHNLIEAVEAFCLEHPWKADLARLRVLIGMGEVEIAEILDIPERSVRRQSTGLPTPHSLAALF